MAEHGSEVGRASGPEADAGFLPGLVPDADAIPDADVADVVVVGAGPAGLAAAAAAGQQGASVVLIDAASQFGGQYWRHPAPAPGGEPDEASSSRFHHGWPAYRALAGEVRTQMARGSIRHLPDTHVWAAQREPDGIFVLSVVPVRETAPPRRSSRRVRAARCVLCPGAYDRQLPVPGWTRPGVMTAGGVQAFVKAQGVSPGRRVLLGGTGPFLLSAAASVLEAGAEVAGICESADLTGWVPGGVNAAAVPAKGLEAAEYVAALVRHRVPFWRRTAVTAIHGRGSTRTGSGRAGAVSGVGGGSGADAGVDRVGSASISRLDASGGILPGSTRGLQDIDVVGLGWGFVPQAELLLQLGAQTAAGADGSLVGVVDDRQAASVGGLYLAGEITGVTGAASAVLEGRIAGRAAAGSTRPARPAERFARAAQARFARTMHRAHPLPGRWEDWLEEETVFCRCEEVRWRQVREATGDLGAADPRSLKGATRTGMGWCQGRICGTAAACLGRAAEKRCSGSAPASDAGGTGNAEGAEDAVLAGLTAVATRPVALPVTFGDLLPAEAPDGSPDPGPPEPPPPRAAAEPPGEQPHRR